MEMEASRHRLGSERTRLGVYHEVLRRLRGAGAREALAPDFADKLWAHFHRFNFRCSSTPRVLRVPPSYSVFCLRSCGCRYAMDVNVDRAEVVLTHMQLLEKATRPENQPAFSVRVVQVHCH